MTDPTPQATGLPPAALAAALKLAQDPHSGFVYLTEETLLLLLKAAAPAIRDEAVAAERKRIAGPVRELLAAAMDYFNEMGAYAAGPPDEWRSEARYAEAEAAIAALIREEIPDAQH